MGFLLHVQWQKGKEAVVKVEKTEGAFEEGQSEKGRFVFCSKVIACCCLFLWCFGGGTWCVSSVTRQDYTKDVPDK